MKEQLYLNTVTPQHCSCSYTARTELAAVGSVCDMVKRAYYKERPFHCRVQWEYCMANPAEKIHGYILIQSELFFQKKVSNCVLIWHLYIVKMLIMIDLCCLGQPDPSRTSIMKMFLSSFAESNIDLAQDVLPESTLILNFLAIFWDRIPLTQCNHFRPIITVYIQRGGANVIYYFWIIAFRSSFCRSFVPSPEMFRNYRDQTISLYRLELLKNI